MKFRNPTDELKSFQIPVGITHRWFTFKPNEVKDLPEEAIKSARAHGFVEVKPEKPKPTVKPVVKKKK